MSLSKRSRYVIPHRRENNEHVIVANPDEEIAAKERAQQQQTPNTTHKSRNPQKSTTMDINEANTFFRNAKFVLQSSKHRSRFVVGTPTTDSCKLFYDQLTEVNRNKVNLILYKLFDKYEPKRIDTNCGSRSWDNFHCKLIYNDEEYRDLLLSLQDKNGKISHCLEHYKQHYQNYIHIHKFIDLGYYQEDLKFYCQYLQQNKKNWYPKIDKNSSKFVFTERICTKLQFDIKNDRKTVLYLDYQTKENRDEFKMVHHKDQINKKIDEVLSAIKYLIKRTSEANKHYIHGDGERFMFEWFKLNIRIHQKNNKYDNDDNDDNKEEEDVDNIVVRIEVYVTIINYLYFVYIYKQKWIKNDRNDKLFQNWFNKYCQMIKKDDLSEKNIYLLKEKFGCNCHYKENSFQLPLDDI